MPKLKANDRVVVITGSGRPDGIGAATALEFAKRGASVVLSDRPEIAKEMDRVRKKILRQQVQCVTVPHDLLDVGNAGKINDAAVDEFGGVTDLVCNAAINVNVPFEELSPQQIQDIITVNLHSHILLSQAVYREFLVQPKHPGVITMISSVNVRWPKGPKFPYIVTKAGLEAAAATLAVEMGEKNRHRGRKRNTLLRANAVAVGPTLTGETKRFGPTYVDEQYRNLATTAADIPQDVATAIAALHFDLTTVTGIALPLAGACPFRQVSDAELSVGSKIH